MLDIGISSRYCKVVDNKKINLNEVTIKVQPQYPESSTMGCETKFFLGTE
jgi:hypothetical protein